MNSLEQHLAATAAHLNAQLCELNELRERPGQRCDRNRRNQNSGMGPAQSLGPHQKWTMNPPSPALEGIERRSLSVMCRIDFYRALIGSLVLTMTGWIYASGWVAPRLI